MIDNLDYARGNSKPIVVIDAGIATNENLELIRKKGYHYLCVSRTKLKDYSIDPDRLTVLLETKSKYNVILKKVKQEKGTDYYLEVRSDKKALKEQGMKTQFEKRFEEELQKIKNALSRKGGIKTVEKVNQRIGRAREKYPSAHIRYNIILTNDAKNKNVTGMVWAIDETKNKTKTEELGKYFLRTSIDMIDEVVVWNVYNTIREVESTFRILKTDLDLRPIYHKNDSATLAHLNLGLLGYWLVNTIRCKLKSNGIKSSWKEIVRIGNTQKVITTSGYNKANNEITVRKCSLPETKLRELHAALNIKQRPFTKLKSVVHKPKIKNLNAQSIRALRSG